MPAVSKKQQRYFGYLLSNPEERKKKGISKKAAKDFAQDIQEVSPPGWGHTKAEKEKTKPWKPKSKIGGSAAAFKRALDDGRFKGLPGSTTKKEKTADMFKLMWSMKKKGDKPHYKPGTDEKKKKYQKEEASQYEKLKKKIGSKEKHEKPVTVDEGQTSYYKDDDRRSARKPTFHDFYKKAKAANVKKQTDAVRSDTKKHGVKFTDAKGSGRIRAGKKHYE
tara:strand:- start:3222 stop:3884 length:663 start_codon:yes stop_codon:yes gene_type:complete